jgi:hypothetical protein
MGKLRDFWKDESSFAQINLPPDFRGWYEVTIARDRVFFPEICPGCLCKGLMIPVQIESREKFGGYYVFFMRWKRMILNIPYCMECATNVLGSNEYQSAWIGGFNANTIKLLFKHKEYADAFRQANGIE